MLKKIWAPLALLALFGVPADAAQAPVASVMQNVPIGPNTPAEAMAAVKAADAAIGASKVKSIHYAGGDASSYVTVPGQSGTSSVQHSWPRFSLKKFDRVIDYETMSMREEQVRAQGAWSADIGGGERPLVGERTQIHFFRDGFSWDQNPDGSIVATPQDAVERRLEIVMTPHGFIREALKARDLRMDTLYEGNNTLRKTRAITFKYMDKYPIIGWLDEENRVTKVTTWFPSPMVGDEYVETRYAQYKAYNGFQFGPGIHQSYGVPPDPSYNFDATTVEINVPNAAVQVPMAVRQSGFSTAVIQTRQLAPGVWMVGANNYNSVVVEFANYIAVIEAPLDEARSIAVMNEARRLIPGKQIRYVVNTHHHYDSAGGLRGYAAEDVLIVTSQTNFDFYESVALGLHPQMVEPDTAGRLPRQVHYVRVLERYTLNDGTRRMEIHHVQDQDHSEDMLMVYLTNEKILVESDLLETPLPRQPTSLNLALLYNIQRVSIMPTRIISLHSGEIPIADFLRVVGQDKIVAQGEGLDAALNDSRP